MKLLLKNNDIININKCFFNDFSDVSGGVIGINSSNIKLTSNETTYYNCRATGRERYDRDDVSGGAVAFAGVSASFDKNCFELCQGSGYGSSTYVWGSQGNSHTSNTYFKIKKGDGSLTNDGKGNMILKNNNFSNSETYTNAGIAVSAPSSDNVIYNNFANLISKLYYIWSGNLQKYKNTNFIDFVECGNPVIMIGLGLALENCIFKTIPSILCKKNANLTVANTRSDKELFAGDQKIINIEVSKELKLNQIGGNFRCNIVTKMKCDLSRFRIGFLVITIIKM